MPEVGVDDRTAFDFLCRTGDIDGGGKQIVVLVPETQDFDAVVFVALDAAKI